MLSSVGEDYYEVSDRLSVQIMQTRQGNFCMDFCYKVIDPNSCLNQI